MRANTWLPHPVASFALWAMWLDLNSTLDFAHVLLGALLGWGIPWLTRRLWKRPVKLSHAMLALRLFFIVMYDIVRANISVARLVLGPVSKLRPAFIQVPLVLTEPFAISALASMITLTPGTVSCALSEDRRILLVHALDVDDVAAMIDEIKTRYEAPLKEIFEC